MVFLSLYSLKHHRGGPAIVKSCQNIVASMVVVVIPGGAFASPTPPLSQLFLLSSRAGGKLHSCNGKKRSVQWRERVCFITHRTGVNPSWWSVDGHGHCHNMNRTSYLAPCALYLAPSKKKHKNDSTNKTNNNEQKQQQQQRQLQN